MPYVLLVIVILVLGVLAKGICIVPQQYAYVVERLGKYQTTLFAGLHWRIPVIDNVVNRVDLREKVVDFPPQPVITKDNVTIEIDTVMYYKVMDAKLYTYGVDSPVGALQNLSATSLRNIIGTMDLDTSLTSRDTINRNMCAICDSASDSWGIKVSRIELQRLVPPHSIQEAMEKQMKAERERREKILRAEGEKQAMILVAQGKNEAMILEAEAKRKATIEEATGKAEAIRLVQQAQADGLKYLNDANTTEAVLRLKALEAFEKASDGKATKIIIPSEIQGIAGLVNGLVESTKLEEKGN